MLTIMALDGQKIQMHLYSQDSEASHKPKRYEHPAHTPACFDEECYYDDDKVVSFYDKRFELSCIYFPEDKNYPDDWEPIDTNRGEFIIVFRDYKTDEIFTIYYQDFIEEVNPVGEDDHDFAIYFYQIMKLIDLLLDEAKEAETYEGKNKCLEQIFKIKDDHEDLVCDMGLVYFP